MYHEDVPKTPPKAEKFDLKGLRSLFYSACRVFGPPPKKFVDFYNSKIISLLLYDSGVFSVLLKKEFVLISFNKIKKIPPSLLTSKTGVFFSRRGHSFSFKEEGKIFKIKFNHNKKMFIFYV